MKITDQTLSPGLYTVAGLPGHPAEIQNVATEQRITPSPISEEYCRFLSSISQVPNQYLPPDLLPRGRYFCNLDTLIEFCKSSSMQIYVSGDDASSIATKTTTYLPSTARHDYSFHEVGVTRGTPFSLLEKNKYGFSCCYSGLFVNDELNNRIRSEITKEDSALRRLASWPIVRTFVYLDVSDFSELKPYEESSVIRSIVEMVNNPNFWPEDVSRPFNRTIPAVIESQICIGDGYIYVFESPLLAVRFAAFIAYLIESLSAHKFFPTEFHFRIGAHVGEVFTFWDPGRNGWNYIGEGINGGQRVLSSIGKDSDDNIFVSGALRSELLRIDPIDSFYLTNNLHSRGRRKDKHKQPWRVFELNHFDIVPRMIGPTHITELVNMTTRHQ